MKLEIKNIDCMDLDLNNLTHEQSELFHAVITISIGFVGENSSDNFDVYIYTVKWLDKNLSSPMLGKNSIIMKQFDFINLYNYLNLILDKCNLLSFNSKDAALKAVSEYFDWEFKNY